MMGKGRGGPGGSGAFTLIELLVVVAIVTLLVGLLMPALGKGRRAAQAAVCLSNTRQLGVAATLYQHGYGGYFPRPLIGGVGPLTPEQRERGLWYNALDPYLGRGGASGRSHDAFKQDPVWGRFDGALQPENRTLKMNGSFCDDETGRHFTREGQVRTPSRAVLFGDGRAFDLRPSDTINAKAFDLHEGVVGLRHDDLTANIAFVDGHASREKQELRDDTVVPTWFLQPDPRQTLIWDVVAP